MDPFLSIENRGQKETWASNPRFAKVIWFEGNAALSGKLSVKFLGRILGILQRTNFGQKKQISVPGIRLFKTQSVDGSSSLRKRLCPAIVRHRIEIQFVSVLDWVHRNGNFLSRVLNLLLKRIGTNQTKLKGDRATCDFPPHWFMLCTFKFLKYKFVIENFKFDFVLFTTATCYVRLDELLRKLANVHPHRFYGGHVLKLGGAFVAGNSIILSRDVLEEVVRLEKHYRLDLPDDVALSRLIRNSNLADITEMPTEHLPIGGASIPEDLSHDWSEKHIIRCKAQPVTQNPEPVIELMRKVHDFLVKGEMTSHYEDTAISAEEESSPDA